MGKQKQYWTKVKDRSREKSRDKDWWTNLVLFVIITGIGFLIHKSYAGWGEAMNELVIILIYAIVAIFLTPIFSFVWHFVKEPAIIDAEQEKTIKEQDEIINLVPDWAAHDSAGPDSPRLGAASRAKFGQDKTRLSKRHGATSVLAYRDMGYLPHALINALSRLGWSFGDQEIFTIDELIENFSLKNVGKAAGIFNAEKLLDLNAHYIRETETISLTKGLLPFLDRLGIKDPDPDLVAKAIDTLKIRCKTLLEMAEGALFYFQEDMSYEQKGDTKFLKPAFLDLLEDLCRRLEQWTDFNEKGLEELFIAFMDAKQIKLGKIAQPLRVALTGKTASPGIFEVMSVLGKEKVLVRIRKAIDHIKKKVNE